MTQWKSPTRMTFTTTPTQQYVICIAFRNALIWYESIKLLIAQSVIMRKNQNSFIYLPHAHFTEAIDHAVSTTYIASHCAPYDNLNTSWEFKPLDQLQLLISTLSAGEGLCTEMFWYFPSDHWIEVPLTCIKSEYLAMNDRGLMTACLMCRGIFQGVKMRFS
jgi:hypothetical protein